MKRLKELRDNRRLTQAELGEKFNISASTIGMYEQGRRDPDTVILRKLADFFHVTTDYLLGRTDYKDLFPEDRDVLDLARKLKKLPPDKRKALEALLGFEEQAASLDQA